MLYFDPWLFSRFQGRSEQCPICSRIFEHRLSGGGKCNLQEIGQGISPGSKPFPLSSRLGKEVGKRGLECLIQYSRQSTICIFVFLFELAKEADD